MNKDSEKNQEREEEAVALVIIILFLGWLVYFGVRSDSFSNTSEEMKPEVERKAKITPEARSIISDTLSIEFQIGDEVRCSGLQDNNWSWTGNIVSINEQLIGVQLYTISADSSLTDGIPSGPCTGNEPLIQTDKGKIIEVTTDCLQKGQ